MKQIVITAALLLLFNVSVRSQTVDYNLMKSMMSQSDSSAMASLTKMGYKPNKDGDYRYVADNKVLAFVSYAKAMPESGQSSSYWAFQLRGKKAYSPVFKEIKKNATVTTGTHFGKPKTEYKSPEGIYYYPFEDSMFDGLYWVYASRESLLDKK
ncbi:hypothetical protein ACFSJU_10255 [Paradesertivirga mongoliensis]|uniref:Uncharacterized protein n=1 Tax=Paradesertivirga mongoliensis TaxID=2100740 RepID=A0ABW4ZMH0_9SPHI|nr:hypothetical protein [Pedobacter mongoliensis]